jgi:hypothetical protein
MRLVLTDVTSPFLAETRSNNRNHRKRIQNWFAAPPRLVDIKCKLISHPNVSLESQLNHVLQKAIK